MSISKFYDTIVVDSLNKLVSVFLSFNLRLTLNEVKDFLSLRQTSDGTLTENWKE